MLLVTQLSYATQLCLFATISSVPAHAMTGELAIVALNSAGPDFAADPCRLTGRPVSAIRPPSGLATYAASPSFDLPAVSVASAGAQWADGFQFETGSHPKLASAPHPPLRHLYCSYII